jgi:uncharacterized protein (TIGR00730 family)
MPRKKSKKIKRSKLYKGYNLPSINRDFRETFQWRIFRIMSEFIEGFEFIADFPKSVAIFGSTRFKPTNPHYKEARKLGKLLVKEGYAVMTGGGPGIMEAGNRGAFEAGGKSSGINIELPNGQMKNAYLTKSLSFHYFFTRKVMLSFACSSYVFFPGGFGTLDEFFEMITLIQTEKLHHSISIVCVGKDYWNKLFSFLEKEVYLKNKAIDKKDLKLFKIVDTAQQALKIIKKNSSH